MANSYYKGYWMITNRCNLNCSYCVLENAPHQLQAELDLAGKKELIYHLYHNLNFRRLTLSGGEALIIGKDPPNDFIELLRYIRKFRSVDPSRNLEIELYTNGTYLDEHVVNEMKGVVGMVAVTIDSSNNSFLSGTGRNHKKFSSYFERAINACSFLSRNNIELKLHSVISRKNILSLVDELPVILDAIIELGGRVSYWKFYQYMSYDVPEKDREHVVSNDLYNKFRVEVENILKNYNIKLHFKDNKEMNESLFNILSYGNAQYMKSGDTWLTSRRTHDLRTYHSMSDLFLKNDIDKKMFHKFHEVFR